MNESIGEMYVTRPFLPPKEEYDRYLDIIWQNCVLTNQGLLHRRFEDALSETYDKNYVTLINNGHMALDIALKALNIKGEVITTPFTFVSTTHVLTTNNITPVFCDIRTSDLTMDPNQIERLITPKTTAIMPVHVYGHFCDVKSISQIAEKYGIKVIYDAAHAFGARYKGNSIARYGDVSMLSFHATKLFHTIEGGALVCGKAELKNKFDVIKNYGFEGETNIQYIGINAKMNEFQAAMGLSILPYISDIMQRRKAATLIYREELADLPGVSLFFPDKDPDVVYNYAYMPILIDCKKFGATRDEVYFRLKDFKIYSRRYFYPLTPDFQCYAGRFDNLQLPVARMAASQVLCLPLWDSITSEQVAYVCSKIKGIRSEHTGRLLKP